MAKKTRKGFVFASKANLADDDERSKGTADFKPAKKKAKKKKAKR